MDEEPTIQARPLFVPFPMCVGMNRLLFGLCFPSNITGGGHGIANNAIF